MSDRFHRLLLVLAAFVLFGCGSSGSPSSVPTSDESSVTAGTSSDDPEDATATELEDELTLVGLDGFEIATANQVDGLDGVELNIVEASLASEPVEIEESTTVGFDGDSGNLAVDFRSSCHWRNTYTWGEPMQFVDHEVDAEECSAYTETVFEISTPFNELDVLYTNTLTIGWSGDLVALVFDQGTFLVGERS